MERKNMKLLAIDTSNKIASVAVFDNNICLGEKLSASHNK